ncbi:hypothetical protein HMPREF9534_00339 [Escherichia coli MS 69-1]|nr:hypothetical protein HMPREF9534_00339 [Escherichia coli MS 69-1]ESD88717.1 hypothetical protein HMPREF1611_01223 [Escherichia coli 908573]
MPLIFIDFPNAIASLTPLIHYQKSLIFFKNTVYTQTVNNKRSP